MRETFTVRHRDSPAIKNPQQIDQCAGNTTILKLHCMKELRMSRTKTPSIDPAVDAVELTQIFGVSLPTIYRWRFDGTLPPTIHTGGRKRRLLWNRDEIIAFLNNRGSEVPLNHKSAKPVRARA